MSKASEFRRRCERHFGYSDGEYTAGDISKFLVTLSEGIETVLQYIDAQEERERARVEFHRKAIEVR